MEGQGRVGLACGARLKDLLLAGKRVGWPRGLAMESCPQEWRPWVRRGSDRAARAGWPSPFGLFRPKKPEIQLAGSPWAGLLWSRRNSFLCRTHPTSGRGEDEALSLLHRLQAEI